MKHAISGISQMVHCTGGKLVVNSPGIPHIQPAHVVTQLEIAQYMRSQDSQHFFTLIKQELSKVRASLIYELFISTTSLLNQTLFLRKVLIDWTL